MLNESSVSDVDVKPPMDARGDPRHVACRPRFLTPLARPSVFSVLMALLLVVEIAAINGYMGAIVSTLEKQFLLSSTEVGAISIINDVVSLLVVGILTYAGHNSHRPRLIGLGAILVGLGTAVCALPHFFADRSSNAGRTKNTSQLCWDFDNSTGPSGTKRPALQPYFGSLSLFIIGQIVVGIGSAPIIPLAMTYVDDAVQKHKTVVYVAVIYIGTSVGPIVGFLLSSWTLDLHVDVDTAETLPINFDRSDPWWIGAWWLGLLVFGAALVLLALPLLLFPRRLAPRSGSKPNDGDVDAFGPKCNGMELRHNSTGADEQDADEMKIQQTDDQSTKTTPRGFKKATKQVKDFLSALLRLCRNLTLVALALGLSTELAIVSGMTTFGAKYIETQFSIPAGRAGLITAITVLPAACVGHLVAGAIVRTFRLSAFQCSVFLCFTVVVTLAIYPFLIIVGCETPPVISSNEGQCSSQCVCDQTAIDPVCGNDDVTYLSPCVAGCTGYSDVENKKFSDCICVKDRNSGTTPQGGGGRYAKASACPTVCTNKVAYIALLSISLFFMFMGQNPTMIINLRCVEEKDRSLAIGMSSFAMKIIGFFPAPPIFGAIINTTCRLYRSSEGAVEYEDSGKSVCWHYDLPQFRQRFAGLLIGLKSFTLLFFLIVAVSLWRRRKEEVQRTVVPQSASSETSSM